MRVNLNVWRRLPYALPLLALSACSSLAPEAPPHTQGKTVIETDEASELRIGFSQYDEQATMPTEWQPLILSPSKKKTEYRLRQHQGKTVLHAKASASASGLKQRLNVRPQKYPWLSWSWKIVRPIPEADNTQRHTEDSPARIVLAFEGDKSKLSFKEQMIMQQAKLLFNQDMPYATLMYIWENRQPVGTVIDNRISGRIKMIVAESGDKRLGEWMTLRRNVLEDYRKAYGEEPGRLVGLAVLTDSDNTKQSAESYYGDMFLQRVLQAE